MSISTQVRPKRRQVSNWTAAALLLGAVSVGAVVGPSLVAEWTSPGTFVESVGVASTAIPTSAPAVNTLIWIQDEAETTLATLPGGNRVTVYLKSDLSGPCASAAAAACSVPGGQTIWLSPAAPSVREVIVHEYVHLQTNLVENLWLRAHGPRLFANATVPLGGVVGLEGVADCGVQLLVSGWAERVTLPYVSGACTDYQLRLARAVLDDEPLWEVAV